MPSRKKYTLKTSSNDAFFISRFLAKNQYAAKALKPNGNTNNISTWNNHEKQLRVLSRLNREILFELTIETIDGPKRGTFWKKYFLDGKCQKAKGKMVFDEFDPNKLA